MNSIMKLENEIRAKDDKIIELYDNENKLKR
jgi:hypothetical protein